MREELIRITYTKEEEQNAELREFWNLRKNVLLGLLAETGIGVQELLALPVDCLIYALSA